MFLKNKQKSTHDFMFPEEKSHYFKCIDKDAWDLYLVADLKAFYFQRHHIHIPTIDISVTQADVQQFTHFGSSSLQNM